MNQRIFPYLLALKLLFSASLSIGQIEPKPITIALPDSITLEFEDDSYKEFYTPEVAKYAQQHFLEKGRNMFISRATENRIKILKGNKSHLADFKLELFIKGKLAQDPSGIEGFHHRFYVGGKLMSKQGKRLFAIPSMSFHADTYQSFKDIFDDWATAVELSLTNAHFSLTTKYVPHKFTEATKSISIDTYFDFNGQLESPKDSILIKNFTQIANNAIVHYLHKQDEHIFNYHDNYAEVNQVETDFVLKGLIVVEGDRVELLLTWEGKENMPEYMNIHTKKYYVFSLTEFQNGDYSDLFRIKHSVSWFLYFAKELK